ncbi:hypothetical protein [Paenibacillus sp. 32352]|uniref:hypothetical protein n=1 Tax=Paenibacillus sp. 32352 TaxID=1969111 RepID=UPI00117FCD3D|nr:hypothetical protein [Paenibacillus sp. 32352]
MVTSAGWEVNFGYQWSGFSPLVGGVLSLFDLKSCYFEVHYLSADPLVWCPVGIVLPAAAFGAFINDQLIKYKIVLH